MNKAVVLVVPESDADDVAGPLIMAGLLAILNRWLSQKRRDRRYARKHRYM